MKHLPSIPAAIIVGLLLPRIFRGILWVDAEGVSGYLIFACSVLGIVVPVVLAVSDWRLAWERRQTMFDYCFEETFKEDLELAFPVWGRMLVLGLSAGVSGFLQFGLRP